MARKIIDIGAVGNDGTGDSIRDSFRKVNDNFRELYSSLGLGEKLTFIGLDDAPASYAGQNNTVTGSTPLVTVNNTESGLAFKKLVPGNGISIDFITNPNEITINADFAEISADTTPQLGGNLSMRSGISQYRIIDAGTTISPISPIYNHELVNKAYADTKIARAGIDAVNPETGAVDPSFGRMSGPLILSRDPEPDDDELYGGLVAATKRYVDSSAFGSSVNLYVALSGQDDRPGVSKALQGRALAYAYRTLEAALKRAEELVNEARLELGPYKKVLTYNNGASDCILDEITPSPTSGSGFIGSLRMSVDTVTLNNLGTNYYAGDILTLTGGTLPPGGGYCTIEVLSTLTNPGAILTYRIVSTGSYLTLPGATGVATTITTSAAPSGIGAIGTGATFNVTYKVNSVSIVNGGTGYSLVSVRVAGGGGRGAFGSAVVTSGVISSITIEDKGSGFTSLPTLSVDLPRFLIKTEGYRTDYTGNVTTDTPEAIRGRDIREGLYLRGETSEALAQILSHSGALDSNGNEIFDVDIKYGSFIEGEKISYGDISKNIQISVLVESGEYYENYPLKVPANVSIVGDEFRRVIFRPKPGTSSSPWAFQRFRRDLTIDGLTTAVTNYGYHYLTDPEEPVYPKIDNKGSRTSTAALLDLNRSFLQEEIIAWMEYNIDNSVSPFTPSFSYDSALCRRDVGLLVDAFVFDLKYGSYNRTVSAGLKYYQNASSLIAITTQLSQYLAVLTHLEDLMQDVVTNTTITGTKQTLYSQIIDQAYSAETGSAGVITALVQALKDIIDDSGPGFGSVNQPKDNEEMDVFLANDAVRWQAISAIGHGGFMGVLDPEGQILSRSPYFQECASFSRSKDRQVFAGGMLVDGFAGNLEFNIDAVVTSTRLEVSDLDRFPQLPCSFIVADTVYRVNYVRDFEYDKDGSTATFILDETTPWPYPVFAYNETACSRDVGLIIDGLGYDIVFGTNYWTRISGLTYRMSQASVVIDDQRTITLEAIELAHDLASAAITAYPTIQTTVASSNTTIASLINRGTSALPTLTFTLPSGLSTDKTSAYTLLMANRDYIVAEVNGWIAAQISGNISPWATGDTYNESKSQRDTNLVIEAVVHDLIYGGNAATRTAALKYYNNLTGTGLLASGQPARCAAAIAYANYLAGQVVQNLAPATSYSALSRVSGTAATSTEAGIINTLMTAVASAISAANYTTAQSFVTLSAPSTSGYTAANIAARSAIVAAKSSIQTEVIDYVNFNGNRYELLMPGNRSMLANDFTQINDLGYGAIAVNGGLLELVSIFTYYCHISYYSLRGGQIRSVGGSSAHGVYALVAEGYDPLEVPTPTTLFEDVAQKVKCYYPSPTYQNTLGGLAIFVYGYDYVPLGSSELEIDHGGAIYRYPVTSVTQEESFPEGVVRLNLSTGTGAAESEGLFAVVNDGTVMTLRQNGQVMLTNDLAEVAVRPSTGLKLAETPDTVYRVLQFVSSVDQNGPYEVTITNSSPATIKITATVTDIADNLCTTSQNHKLKTGDKFIPTSTANGFTSGTTYYVIEVPEYNQFKVSTTVGGTETSLTNGTGLTIKGVKTHKLLENYTISFRSVGGTLPTGLTSAQVYYVSPNNLTDTEFSVSAQRNGDAINTTSAGSGTFTLTHEGLTKTTLRENYDYIEYTMWQPGVSAYYTDVVSNTTSSTNLITLSTISYQVRPGMPIVFAGTSFGGITAGTTYYVLSSPYSASIPVATVARSSTTATIVTSVNHGLATGQTVNINSTGTALDSDNAVVITVSDATTFTYTSGASGSISTTAAVNGRVIPDAKITISTSVGGSAVALTTASGLLTGTAGGPVTATISIATPAVVTLNNHGYVAGEVFKFETTGSLPSGVTPLANYHVLASGLTTNTFKFSSTPGGTPIDTSGSQSGTHSISRVAGREGDTNWAIVAVATEQRSRVVGSKFMWQGEEYIVTQYDSEEVTNEAYARIYVDRPLVNSLIAYGSSYTAKGAVAIRTASSLGNLTIRISLTRVTSHDLLEIGTGSYADTNYPKEIYGASVNALNEETETAERDVGRCFYVTTDQYGNFKVGPYFKVDQGTGTVTFSASIALSNLDGIGFKRGVPVSEFSTDSSFSDNATDTVPTENAARIYIERRLGVTHDGSNVVAAQLIPATTGGFLALSGQQAMKGDIDMGSGVDHKILNLADATLPTDAVNLRSLTLNNFQNWAGGNIDAADFMVFTGAGNTLINATVTGDVSVELRTGTDSSLNQLDVQIVPGTIINSDVNASAGIEQSKLAMTAASTRASATGITQADRGLASFSSADFDVTDGWVNLKANSVALGDLAQIGTKTVLANSTLSTANVSAVAFSTVVDDGGAIKKTQYSTSGFLRRTSSSSFASDADYAMVEAAAGSSVSVEGSKIVIRDSNGDFGGRTADLQSIKIDANLAIDTATIATGGYIRYYGYGSAGGILIQDSTLAAEKKTAYWNDLHQFKTQSGGSDAPITASSIQVLTLTTGASGTGGTITGNWSLSSGSRLQATYSADLAEWYTSDKKYEAGTVVVFGGDAETTTTTVKGDTRVAGVVSTDPAYIMNGQLEKEENAVCVALQGRVPCKVVGKINKGDLLITSSVPGVAIAASSDVKVGTVVGKALQAYDSNHIGTIEVAVGRT